MASIQARFTREGYDRLKNELETLKTRRGEIINDIRETREQGDLRENHAYHAAKDAQGMLEARITELEQRLGDAVVLGEGEVCDEVMLGIPVTVRLEGADADDVRVYTIVHAEELDNVENGASEESPVGSALLGKKVGDIAEVQGPRGVVRFEVVSIGEES
jgi:transcription elongation factor GreA